MHPSFAVRRIERREETVTIVKDAIAIWVPIICVIVTAIVLWPLTTVLHWLAWTFTKAHYYAVLVQRRVADLAEIAAR